MYQSRLVKSEVPIVTRTRFIAMPKAGSNIAVSTWVCRSGDIWSRFDTLASSIEIPIPRIDW